MQKTAQNYKCETKNFTCKQLQLLALKFLLYSSMIALFLAYCCVIIYSSKTQLTDKRVPYSSSSPWNTPISSTVTIDPNSDHYLLLWTSDNPLRSTPNEYDEALYITNSSTDISKLHLSKTWSVVTNNNHNVSVTNDVIINLPIPKNAVPSPGSDGEIILWNPSTNSEYGFWQFSGSNGDFTATDGYSYNTTLSGVPIHVVLVCHIYDWENGRLKKV